MCGIAGIAGESIDPNVVKVMIAMMKHRGPDNSGFYLSDSVHLGHARLAINDLTKQANQPFISEEHNIAVSLNGEIYNFKDFKGPLEQKGYKFQSWSDSEIVLHAYIEYGLKFISDLNGMFGISIWDGNKKELYLIRDRLGIKPLYYAKAGHQLLFASELKALAQYRELDLSIDLQSFAEYVAFENVFANRTLNKNIKMVSPGEIVSFRLSDHSIKAKYFWTTHFNVYDYPFQEDIYKKYLRILEASVKRHLISDVPVGSYLSAGFDSSSVAYWSSRALNGNLKTFTGSFGVPGFYDEATDAAKIAKYFNCPNRRVEIRPEDFIENIEKIIWHLDEPKVGMGSFSQYMVAKEASKEVKVILTGHGGDEFFAGYPVFKTVYGKKNPLKLIANSSLRDIMFASYFSFLPLFRKEIGYFLPNIFPRKAFKSFLKADFYQSLIRNTNIFKELDSIKRDTNDEYQQLTLTYLKLYLPSLFVVEDKIGMAFSLESRTPLCDNEMLNLALSLPLQVKLLGYELKHIPKTAMKGKLPDSIYKLPKRGFPTPLKLWFRKELKHFIKDFIFDNICYAEMLDRGAIEKIIYEYQNRKIRTPFDEINAHKIWVILNLVIYFKFQKSRYKVGNIA